MADGAGLDREMQALAALKEALAAECANDPEFVLSLAEGETDLIETIDALLAADALDDEMIDGADRAIKAIGYRKERFEGRKEVRRGLLERALLMLDQKKLERPAATLSLANRAPKAEIADESQIPARFFKSKPTLDRKAVKDALDAGEDVPGARLSNGTVSLTIRRK